MTNPADDFSAIQLHRIANALEKIAEALQPASGVRPPTGPAPTAFDRSLADAIERDNINSGDCDNPTLTPHGTKNER